MALKTTSYSFEEIEQMRLEWFFLSTEANNPEISLKKILENKEKKLQLNQKFYKKTGRLITD